VWCLKVRGCPVNRNCRELLSGNISGLVVEREWLTAAEQARSPLVASIGYMVWFPCVSRSQRSRIVKNLITLAKALPSLLPYRLPSLLPYRLPSLLPSPLPRPCSLRSALGVPDWKPLLGAALRDAKGFRKGWGNPSRTVGEGFRKG